MLSLRRVSALVVTARILFEANHALACSLERPPSIEISGLEITTSVSDDRTSSKACSPNQGSSCGPDVRYEGLVKKLLVKATGKPPTGSGPIENSNATILLKDERGVEIARSQGEVAVFDKLGATACVIVPARATQATPSEICAPVTVKSLTPTPAELSAHEDSVSDDCGVFGSACSLVGRRSDESSNSPWALVGLVALACTLRARRLLDRR
jgi:hypothetical protein